MALTPTTVAALCFVLILASAAVFIFGGFGGEVSVPGRLGSAPQPADDQPPSIMRTQAKRANRLVRWRMRGLRDERTHKPSVRAVQKMLTNAGFTGIELLARFYVIRLIAFCTGAIVGFGLAIWLGGSWVPYAASGSLLGYFLPYYLLRRKVRARQSLLVRDLPASLDLLVVSLEAGLGMSEAIRIVGQELDRRGRLMGKELSQTASDMAAGVSLADSLRNFAERTGVDDIKSLVALIIQSEKIGARLSPALRASADLLNARRRSRAEEAAQRSAVKMLVPLVFLILPSMMLMILGPAIISILKQLG